MSLKLYSSFIRRDKDNKIEDIAIIRETFSFLALFFSLPWFLCHKMWKISLILVLFEIFIIKLFTLSIISGFDIFVINLGFLLLIATNANNLYGRYLQKKGYQKANFVLAQNEEEARLKSMKSLHRNCPDLNIDEFSLVEFD